MTTTDYLIHLVLSVILIVGGYQFYFWCQRNGRVAPREFKLSLDERLPYWPSWVWIYSFLYYPLIVCVNLVTSSAREFTHMATSYLVLLSLQMACFLAFPVATPEHWRHYNQRRTLAERFLALVQKFDARSNSFPSMHVSVAMLTALHLAPACRIRGIRLPGADRALVHLHQAALRHRPAGRRAARLGDLPRLR
jgi:membrane-associated phospholipid phosphatase